MIRPKILSIIARETKIASLNNLPYSFTTTFTQNRNILPPIPSVNLHSFDKF